ncbi:MAG: PIN domain-containing protein [Solirubrobacterales bacterium]
MLIVDTSVVVAAFGGWHVRHAEARSALRDRPRITAHGALESYSVLTRLPSPHTAPAEVAVEFLRRRFPPAERLALSAASQRRSVDRLAELGIIGGAVYDGLIALAAAEEGGELVSFDQRALVTYRRCGATVRDLGP